MALPIYGLLTKSQETETFTWWLDRWQRLGGALSPAFAISDSQRALLNGMCMSFNHQSIKTFVETCFLYAQNNKEYYYRPTINTYIRIDVAHFIIMIRKWPCFQNELLLTPVRKFYMYCVSLMIDCQTLEKFTEMFSLVCTVALHEYLDSKIEVLPHGTVQDAKERLETYIETRNFDHDFDDTLSDDEKPLAEEVEVLKEETHRSRIRTWIDNLRSKSEVIVSQGSSVNPFYFRSFIDRFMTVAYEFPLWSAAAIPHEAGHATTACSEERFKYLKRQLLRNYSGPLRADKFLKVVFEDDSANVIKFSSNLGDFHEANIPLPSPKLKQRPPTIDSFISGIDENVSEVPTEPQRINKTSNVKYKIDLCDDDSEDDDLKENSTVTVKKKRTKNDDNKLKPIPHNPNKDAQTSKTKYFRQKPNIKYQNDQLVNIEEARLLRNGNLIRKATKINGGHYFATNTCGWDSTVQILTGIAMDNPRYLELIKKADNETLQFVVKFAGKERLPALYKERVNILLELFPEKVKSQSMGNYKLSSYSIDVTSPITLMFSRCFQLDPSVVNEYSCSKCGHSSTYSIFLSANFKIINQKGFQALQEALSPILRPTKCQTRDCFEYHLPKPRYQSQIFIELDIIQDDKTSLYCQLKDMPVTLSFNEDQYR